MTVHPPQLQFSPAAARRALFARTDRYTWGRYLTLGMGRAAHFAHDAGDETVAGLMRQATYYERECLAAQDYLDQLDREREAYAA